MCEPQTAPGVRFRFGSGSEPNRGNTIPANLELRLRHMSVWTRQPVDGRGRVLPLRAYPSRTRLSRNDILSLVYGKPEHHALKQMMVMIAVNGPSYAEAVIKFCQEPGGMLNHNPDKSRTGNFDLLPRKYPGLAWREL
ncbi:hypothetical protein B0H10DRAFT_1966034 [Mycena sp. CBHHK59/15]|nr:hypothetical protein B0H10DRAFT_1966034 [Mycena sp. CBHHK59/15]